ncbi:hypothetical protein GCM10010187_31280 [Actinomadura coerulea]|nr:hypothetical protein GCM10010187_31280 [Actinomadura coerulea]
MRGLVAARVEDAALAQPVAVVPQHLLEEGRAALGGTDVQEDRGARTASGSSVHCVKGSAVL